MKLEIKHVKSSNLSSAGNIKPGECFLFENNLCMRAKSETIPNNCGEILVLRFNDQYVFLLNYLVEVEKVKAVLSWEKM